MKIAVIGAGAVGATLAALLDRAGHTVEVTARGAGLEAIGRVGLRLEGAWGSHTARVAASETLRAAPELAIIATKAMDAKAAAHANSAHLVGVPVVVVQNGFGGLEAVAAALPHSPVIGGLALFAASYTAAGCVTVTAAASLYLGMVQAADDAPARAAARVLSDALPTRVVDNFAGARWTKLIINQVNALPAITGLSVQDVIAHRALRLTLTRSMREAVRFGLARGVHFETLNGVTHRALRLLSVAPTWAGQLLPLRMGAYLGDVPNPGSTLQSIRRGQATEIDFLNGAIVAESAAVGVPAPVNALLTALVHEVERTGEFLTPAEVTARVANTAG